MTRRHSLTRAPRRSSVAFRSGLAARTAHLAMLGLFALACSKGESPSQGSTGQPAGAASAPPAAPSAAPSSAPLPAPTTASAVAVGPELVVVPGVGLSAIRFGATFDTLERQMTAKCEVRTETRCTFVDQAVDFTMKDGVVVGMKVNRRGRAVPGIPGRLFGFFKGFAPPQVQLGLHRHIVHEELGLKLERSEDVKGPDGLVAREYYPGLVIEYDQLPNGNVVAGAFEVLRVAGGPAVPHVQIKPLEP